MFLSNIEYNDLFYIYNDRIRMAKKCVSCKRYHIHHTHIGLPRHIPKSWYNKYINLCNAYLPNVDENMAPLYIWKNGHVNYENHLDLPESNNPEIINPEINNPEYNVSKYNNMFWFDFSWIPMRDYRPVIKYRETPPEKSREEFVYPNNINPIKGQKLNTTNFKKKLKNIKNSPNKLKRINLNKKVKPLKKWIKHR